MEVSVLITSCTRDEYGIEKEYVTLWSGVMSQLPRLGDRIAGYPVKGVNHLRIGALHWVEVEVHGSAKWRTPEQAAEEYRRRLTDVMDRMERCRSRM